MWRIRAGNVKEILILGHSKLGWGNKLRPLLKRGQVAGQ